MTPWLLLPLLLAQTHASWETSVRVEARARNLNPQDGSQDPKRCPAAASGGTCGVGAADLALQPRVSGAVFSGAWTFAGSYGATVWLREPYDVARRANHAHVWQVDGVWAREGSHRFFAGEYLTYGTLDLSNFNSVATTTGPSPPPPGPPGAVPLFGTTEELTTDTSLGVDWTLERDLTLTTSAGYTYGGGVNQASQFAAGTGEPILPLQSSPRGLVRLLWLASRLDTVALSAIGRYTRFQACLAPSARVPCSGYAGAEVGLGELSARYARLLAEHTSVDLTAGVTAAYGKLAHAAPVPGVKPMGEAGISHRIQLRSQRWDLRISGQAGPYIDRFRGTVYERVEGNGTVGWGNVFGASAYLRGGVAQSLTGNPTTDLFTAYGEAGAGYQGAPWWRVELAGRQAMLRSGAPATWQSQWVVGLSATFTAVSAPQTAATE